MKKILYLHGLGRNGHDELYQNLRKYVPEDIEILTLDISPRRPKKSYEEIQKIVEENNPTIVIGFSMGGFFADLISLPLKLYINPALHLPEYISRKSGPLVEEFNELARKYRFKNNPRKCIDIVGNQDNKIGIPSEALFSKNYKHGKVIRFEGGHDINELEIREIVIPLLRQII